jgi:hypothetical protein
MSFRADISGILDDGYSSSTATIDLRIAGIMIAYVAALWTLFRLAAW